MRIEATSVGMALLLCGCSTLLPPRSLDYEISPGRDEGSITVSFPKVFSREALLEERRRDGAWLDRLMVESADPSKVTFGPTVIREMENVSALAAAIGLSFDPASGANYRRQSEVGELQQQIGLANLRSQIEQDSLKQQIDIIKLDAQLMQLKADMALLEAGFADQEGIVTTGLGTSAASPSTLGSTAGAGPVTGAGPGVSTAQLDAAIAKLTADLNASLVAQGKAPMTFSANVSPMDDFRDRAAYRDMLKSAINSNALDELHDLNGSNLIRLNFQATVLPQDKQLRSLASLEMQIVAGEPNIGAWLDYLNGPLSQRVSGAFPVSSDPKQLAGAGALLLVKIGATELVLPNELRLASAIEGITGGTVALSGSDGKSGLVDTLTYLPKEDRQRVLEGFCGKTGVLMGLYPLLEDRQTLQTLPRIRQWLSFDPTVSDRKTAFLSNLAKLDAVAANLGEMSFSCKDDLGIGANAKSPPAFLGTSDLIARATGLAAPRVYDIGPRQQVQQVSTVARNASSLALAASIAAADPSAGTSGSAAASYARRNSSLAAAIERVPAVVGFVNAARIADPVPPQTSGSTDQEQNSQEALYPSFGWVFGPRAVLDKYGRVQLRQTLATHDVSVDLAVPGFWSSMQIHVRRSWGSTPGELASGGQQAGSTYTITVPLRPDSEVFANLNKALIGVPHTPNIKRAYGGKLNACSPATLVIEGEGVWRTQSALVMGKMIDGSAIKVLPDMQGITFAVPKIEQSDPAWPSHPDITLFTPSGSVPVEKNAHNTIEYHADAFKAACSPTAAAPDPNAPKFSVLGDSQPLRFVMPNPIKFNLSGSNLDKVTSVYLGTVEGEFTADKSGKSAKVTIAKEPLGQLGIGRFELVFYYGDGKTLKIPVELTK